MPRRTAKAMVRIRAVSYHNIRQSGWCCRICRYLESVVVFAELKKFDQIRLLFAFFPEFLEGRRERAILIFQPLAQLFFSREDGSVCKENGHWKNGDDRVGKRQFLPILEDYADAIAACHDHLAVDGRHGQRRPAGESALENSMTACADTVERRAAIRVCRQRLRSVERDREAGQDGQRVIAGAETLNQHLDAAGGRRRRNEDIEFIV